jgi:hypothetical protein
VQLVNNEQKRHAIKQGHVWKSGNLLSYKELSTGKFALIFTPIE